MIKQPKIITQTLRSIFKRQSNVIELGTELRMVLC